MADVIKLNQNNLIAFSLMILLQKLLPPREADPQYRSRLQDVRQWPDTDGNILPECCQISPGHPPGSHISHLQIQSDNFRSQPYGPRW